MLLAAIGMLCRSLVSLDLRDNRIDDEEAAVFADAITHDGLKVRKLNLAGNRIGSRGLALLSRSVTVSELLIDGNTRIKSSSVAELTLSRNRLARTDPAPLTGVGSADDAGGGEGSDGAGANASADATASATGEDGDGAGASGIAALGRAVARSGRLAVVILSRTSLSDADGAELCDALSVHASRAANAAAAAANGASPLRLGASASKPPLMPLMRLDLSHNRLGPAFGAALGPALTACSALTELILRGNGLGVAGGRAVASALQVSRSLRLVDLTATNLCNCSPRHAESSRSVWSGEAIEALAKALQSGATVQSLILAQNEIVGLWRERIGGAWATQGTYTTAALEALIGALHHERLHLKKRGGLTISDNQLLKHDVIRLERALLDNEKRPRRATHGHAAAGSPAKATRSALGRAGHASSGAWAAADAWAAPAADAEPTAAQSAFEGVDGAGGSDDDGGEDGGGAPRRLGGAKLHDLSWLDDLPSTSEDDDEAAAAAPAPASPVKTSPIKGGGRRPGASPASGKGAGAGGRASSGGAPPSAGKAGTTPAAGAAAAEGAFDARAGRPPRRGSPEKKKKVAAEPEPEADPYAALMMFIARTTLVVRQEQAKDSAHVQDASGADVKIAPSSLMRVIETHDIIQGITKTLTRRMKVILDGDQAPIGWVTGLTADGVDNLRPASAGYVLKRVCKPLVCREAKETDSKKLEEVPRHAMVRVLAEATMADGSVRAKLGKDTVHVEEIGWVTVSKPGAEGEANNLEAPPQLASTFDLKAHTARSLAKALKRREASSQEGGQRRKRKGDSGLPFQPAGRHPATHSPDDGLPSRHEMIREPAQMALMFNMAGAAFEVTQWSGAMPFELPDEQAFDLYAARPKGAKMSKAAVASRRRLGRVGLARDLKMPFLERIEFPDEWVLAEGDLAHDGWQGSGTLELELICGKVRACGRAHA